MLRKFFQILLLCFASAFLLSATTQPHLKTGFYALCSKVEKGLGSFEEENSVGVVKAYVNGFDCATTAERFYKVETIDLRWRTLSTTSIFSGLGNARFILINGNPIKNIEISNLPILQGLFANSTGAETLTLSNLSSLREVRLGENKLKTVSLKNLGAVEIFDVSNNELTDVSFVSQLPSLNRLHVENNKLTTLNVKNLQVLTILQAENNQIKDIKWAKEMQALEHLHMSNNLVSDLTPISKLYYLSSIKFNNNRLTDISVLADHIEGDVVAFEFADNPIVKDEAHCPVLNVRSIQMRMFCARLRDL